MFWEIIKPIKQDNQNKIWRLNAAILIILIIYIFLYKKIFYNFIFNNLESNNLLDKLKLKLMFYIYLSFVFFNETWH